MSLNGALDTAVSGLTAQAAAFGNISDNVANSQTVGFKGTDTAFLDHLTVSTAEINDSGAVVALPDYTNTVQGNVSQSDNPLALAITGQGLFAVSQTTGTANGVTEFSSQQFYTRTGDFQMNSAGYLVNSAGQYLNGWNVNSATGVADQTSLAPIQVSQTAYNPVETANVDLSANLPATPTSGTGTSANPITSDVQIYDSLGTAQTVQLNWVQNASNDWTVSIVAPTNTDGSGNLATAVGSAEVQFGPVTSGQTTVSAGTIGNFGGSFGGNQSGSSNITTSSFTLGTPATISFSLNYGNGFQPITLSLGNFGSSSGVTQYAGTTYDLRGITQDGVAPGQFSGVTTKSNGDIVLNYSNGQTKTFAQVPLATFNNPDALQRHDGQTFTTTESSGNPLLQQAGTNGAGNLVTNSTEGSNVDIATEFSKLIVAQQAYTANAKVVTTANQLLTTTIDMKQ